MNDISKNDLRGYEAMLYSQAQALQAIFVNAAIRVTEQEWFSNSEAYMQIALKAQSQCRATLETLAQIRNPPVVFARQANIAQGPQQVNNGMPPAGEPRAGARETESAPDKLEAKPHERLTPERSHLRESGDNYFYRQQHYAVKGNIFGIDRRKLSIQFRLYGGRLHSVLRAPQMGR